jgi:hypothetical protein
MSQRDYVSKTLDKPEFRIRDTALGTLGGGLLRDRHRGGSRVKSGRRRPLSKRYGAMRPRGRVVKPMNCHHSTAIGSSGHTLLRLGVVMEPLRDTR